MAVTLAPGVKKRVLDYESSIFLQVRHPSDYEKAANALERAADDVAGIRVDIPCLVDSCRALRLLPLRCIRACRAVVP